MPTTCNQNGRRRRRAVREGRSFNASGPETLYSNPNITTDWSGSLRIRVKRPDSPLKQEKAESDQPCQLYLLLTAGVAVTFFCATIICVTVLVCCRDGFRKPSSKLKNSAHNI